MNDIWNTNNPRVFGGIPVVLGGDFPQILPVILHGTRQATVLACIRHASIWANLHIRKLKTSICVIASDANQFFLTFLKDLVTNPLLHANHQLLRYILHVSTVDQLCDSQQLLNNAVNNHQALIGRAILAFRNDTVNDFNDVLVDRMPGEEICFEAANHVEVPEDAARAEPFAVAYLQCISLASISPSCLRLKIGAPIILLRNLSLREGLCNGTRMRLLGIRRTCLQVAIMGEKLDGKICLLPRIKLTISDDDIPFILERTQFPVHLCLAISVNKSQTQSLQPVGIDLSTCTFTHGQLYVALSRVEFVTGRKGPRKMWAPGPFPALHRSKTWGGVSFLVFPAPVPAQAPAPPIPRMGPH